MKWVKTVAALALAALCAFQTEAGYVKGYYRKNGTYVAPHYSKSSKKSYSQAISDTYSSSSSSSKKSSASVSAKTKYTGKSYDVYQQRQAQGSRTFSKSMRQKKYEEQGGNCAHCGKHCSSVSEMDGDHIQPYSKGGKTEYSNLQMLCPHCNRSKGNKGTY